MKRYIWIEVKTKNQSRVLLKLFKQNINVLEVKYLKDKLQFKIAEEEQKKLKKSLDIGFTKYLMMVFLLLFPI